MCESLLRFQQKINHHFNSYIDKVTEKEKRNFYKKYGKEPRDIDVQDIKKEIVMKYGLLLFFFVVAIVFSITI